MLASRVVNVGGLLRWGSLLAGHLIVLVARGEKTRKSTRLNERYRYYRPRSLWCHEKVTLPYTGPPPPLAVAAGNRDALRVQPLLCDVSRRRPIDGKACHLSFQL